MSVIYLTFLWDMSDLSRAAEQVQTHRWIRKDFVGYPERALNTWKACSETRDTVSYLNESVLRIRILVLVRMELPAKFLVGMPYVLV